ncbi:MAG: cupin domain-containing protein [Candidatus Bathyarchaeia archaeon]
MEVINIDEIEGSWIGDKTNNTYRRLKLVYTSKNMKVHVGIFPPLQASSEHSHPNSEEICYIIKGEGEVKCSDKVRKFKTNYIVFIPPNEMHQYKNTSEKEEMILIAFYSPPTELPKK